VAVRAAGINGADLLQRKGLYPPPPGVPEDIPGMELAGEVVATGASVTRFAVGDRVMALVGGGAQAELATVAEEVALPVPDGLGWAEAGGFPEVFATAHDALVTQGRLVAGDRLLVSGAAGGVGTAGVQLGRALGAHVVASVRATELHPQVRALGADEVVEPDGVPDHGPYDVSLELVGAPGIGPALGALATGGRIVVIGVGAGARVELDLLALMGKRATIGGSTLRARPLGQKAAVTRAVGDRVLPWLADGTVRVPVAATFPLSEAAAAYGRFAAGAKLGKIVLVAA
jgi:NADPH:quinone reductase-like Zn-dependent oxidoreductase